MEIIGLITKENYENLIMRETVQDFFRKFTYFEEEDEKKKSNSISYKNSPRKFINPHISFSPSIESTRISNKKTKEKFLPCIYQKKLFNNILFDSQSNPVLIVKTLKKSTSQINYNYLI